MSVTGIILARELGEITEEGRRAKRDENLRKRFWQRNLRSEEVGESPGD